MQKQEKDDIAEEILKDISDILKTHARLRDIAFEELIGLTMNIGANMINSMLKYLNEDTKIDAIEEIRSNLLEDVKMKSN